MSRMSATASRNYSLPFFLAGAVIGIWVFKKYKQRQQALKAIHKLWKGVSLPAITVDGTYYPSPPYTHESIDAFRRYRPCKQDLFVVTTAKAGTTWMLNIAYEILTRGRALRAEQNIDDVYRWMAVVEAMRDCHPTLEDLPTDPRLIKSHLKFEHIPFDHAARYVYVCRNPADCLVSYAKMKSALDTTNPPPHGYVELALENKSVYGSWAAHADGWWQASQQHRNILFVFFEDMVADLPKVVLQMCAWLDVSLLEEEMARVLKHCSFRYMKERIAIYQPRSLQVEASKEHGALEGFSFIRKGKVGGAVSSEGITARERLLLLEHYLAELQGADSPFLVEYQRRYHAPS